MRKISLRKVLHGIVWMAACRIIVHIFTRFRRSRKWLSGSVLYNIDNFLDFLNWATKPLSKPSKPSEYMDNDLTKRFFKRSVLLESSACTICYQRDEKRRWQTDCAVPEHSNRWLLELLNTATLLSHIAYQILIKCVCVPGHIFSAFISHVSCIIV